MNLSQAKKMYEEASFKRREKEAARLQTVLNGAYEIIEEAILAGRKRAVYEVSVADTDHIKKVLIEGEYTVTGGDQPYSKSRPLQQLTISGWA